MGIAAAETEAEREVYQNALSESLAEHDMKKG